jgi:hypothetical protein
MVKIECEVFSTEGTLQKVGKNYYRIRHYDGVEPSTRKLRFLYHQNSKEYAENQLEKLGGTKSLENTVFDQGRTDQEVFIDRKLKESSPIFRNRRAGSLARSGHLLDVQKVTGSNPVRPTTTNPISRCNRQHQIHFFFIYF